MQSHRKVIRLKKMWFCLKIGYPGTLWNPKGTLMFHIELPFAGIIQTHLTSHCRIEKLNIIYTPFFSHYIPIFCCVNLPQSYSFVPIRAARYLRSAPARRSVPRLGLRFSRLGLRQWYMATVSIERYINVFEHDFKRLVHVWQRWSSGHCHWIIWWRRCIRNVFQVTWQWC